MANKEFKIQSNTVSLNGVPLSASADAKVVIPGITRATGYSVEEIEDTGDQSHSFQPGGASITVVDKITFDIILFNGDASNCADYSVELDDNNGYIASIQVNGRGLYTQNQADTNSVSDMYAYIGSGDAGARPIDPNDWLAIPFRPKMQSSGIESEFGSGSGASNLSDLNDVDLSDPQNGQALVWDGNDEVWKNQNISGSGSLTISDGQNPSVTNVNEILINGNVTEIEPGIVGITITGVSLPGLSSEETPESNVGETEFNLSINANSQDSEIFLAVYKTDTGATTVAHENRGPGFRLGSGDGTHANNSIAIGNNDVGYEQSARSIAIGHAAGWADVTGIGEDAIAIGSFAAYASAPANSITLNASGASFNPDQSGFFVNPVRNDDTNTAKAVYYNISTGELTFTDPVSGIGPTNEITNTDGSNTYSVSVGTNGVISMNTARGGIEFGAMPEVGGPQHLHIMRPAGQEGSTDLFFGDDYNYVKLPGLYGSGSQGVEIGSSYDSGSVSTWRFGTDGKLTLPASGDIVDSTGTSVLGGGSGNSLAPELTKSGGNLVATTTLEFQGTMYGCFFDVDSGGNFDVWLQMVTGDGEDMSYAIGSNDDGYNFVYAFRSNGAVYWKVGLDDIDGNDLTAYGMKYHNGSLYLVGQYYNNNASRDQIAVVKLNIEDGSVAQSWVLATSDNNNNVWWNPKDITVDSNNNPIVVGSVYGEAQTITGVAAQAGSTNNFLVVNASDISSGNIDLWGTYYVHTDPNDSNAWYQVNSVNTFRDLETTTLTGNGSGLRVAIRYNSDLGSGTGWRFDWCWIENSGSGYGAGDQVKILGSQIGGIDGVNDVILSHNGWYMNILSTDGGANSTQEIQSFVYNYTRFYTSQNVDYAGGNWDIRLGLNDNAFIWSPVWQHTYGKTNGEEFFSVAVDSDNNVYALGDFYDSSSGNAHRVILMKLDSDGDQQWVKYVESDNYNGNPGSVAIDSNNNCIVISKDNNGYTLVTKLDTNGDVVWQSKQTNNSNWDNQPIGGVDSDDNIVLAGSWSANNNVTSVQKISGSDGSLLWARQFRNQQEYDMYEYYDEEAQAGKVVGNFIYYGGYCYDANDDQYVGFGFRLPTDGTGAGTYGRYIYSEDNDAYWEDNTNSAVLTTATYPAIDAISMSTQMLGATTTADAVGSQTVHNYGIGTGGGMTGVESIAFSDGSVQTTAYTGAETITWVNPNSNTWSIVTYNGGTGVYYNGNDTSACWFDAANSPLGDNNFRGAIIEYHAYVNSGTIIGTIHISSDYWSNGTVTHTESMSGNSNVNTCEFWYTDNNRRLYFRRTDGNGDNAMIQWTARCFYGQENDC